jgi:3-dehydroquinate synthase
MSERGWREEGDFVPSPRTVGAAHPTRADRPEAYPTKKSEQMNLGEVIELSTGLEVSSPYYMGDSILQQLPEYLRRHDFDRSFLVTSQKLWGLFGGDVVATLREASIHCEPILIPESESNKSWETLEGLCERLVAAGATKDSLLLALGGGVIGNIVGLSAALLYRGVRFVEMPTTIMSQTDGTLSNKQAINGAAGKNQFGMYHAPLFIWSDCHYVRSEPLRQRLAGVVEGVKNVLISQPNVAAAQAMLDLADDDNRLPDLILLLVQSKLPIIQRDPTERGYGIVLEYGHTFGHAIEWLSQGQLFHGEAVAIGMCAAAELSHALGHMSEDFLLHHYRLLDRLGVPTALPAGIGAEAVYESMLRDNKRTKRGVTYILLSGCGEVIRSEEHYTLPVEPDIVLQTLRRVAVGRAGRLSADRIKRRSSAAYAT